MDVREALNVLKNAYSNRNMENLPKYEGRDWPAKNILFEGLLDEINYKIEHQNVDFGEPTGIGSEN